MGNKKKKQKAQQHQAHVIPVVNKNDAPQQIRPSSLGFVPDQRQARIDALTSDLQERLQIEMMINKFGGFENFVAANRQAEGRIRGLQESLQLAPPAEAPAPPAFPESEGK